MVAAITCPCFAFAEMIEQGSQNNAERGVNTVDEEHNEERGEADSPSQTAISAGPLSAEYWRYFLAAKARSTATHWDSLQMFDVKRRARDGLLMIHELRRQKNQYSFAGSEQPEYLVAVSSSLELVWSYSDGPHAFTGRKTPTSLESFVQPL